MKTIQIINISTNSNNDNDYINMRNFLLNNPLYSESKINSVLKRNYNVNNYDYMIIVDNEIHRTTKETSESLLNNKKIKSEYKIYLYSNINHLLRNIKINKIRQNG